MQLRAHVTHDAHTEHDLPVGGMQKGLTPPASDCAVLPRSRATLHIRLCHSLGSDEVHCLSGAIPPQGSAPARSAKFRLGRIQALRVTGGSGAHHHWQLPVSLRAQCRCPWTRAGRCRATSCRHRRISGPPALWPDAPDRIGGRIARAPSRRKRAGDRRRSSLGGELRGIDPLVLA